MRRVMVDLETLGHTPSALVVQIGACDFDLPDGRIIDTFSHNCSVQSGMDAGFEITASTLLWWLGQDDDARTLVFKQRTISIMDAMTELNRYLRGADEVWCHATFDAPIITHHTHVLGIELSVPYYRFRDIRTLEALSGVGVSDRPEREGTHHTALDDCIYQVALVKTCFDKLGG